MSIIIHVGVPEQALGWFPLDLGLVIWNFWTFVCVCVCVRACVYLYVCVCDHVYSHSRSLKVQGRDYLRSTALSVHWDASLFMKRYFKVWRPLPYLWLPHDDLYHIDVLLRVTTFTLYCLDPGPCWREKINGNCCVSVHIPQGHCGQPIPKTCESLAIHY